MRRTLHSGFDRSRKKVVEGDMRWEGWACGSLLEAGRMEVWRWRLGERALLLVPARRCQMDQGLSRFSVLSVSRESSDKQRTDLENIYIYSIHRYHERDERIRDLRLGIEDLSRGVWRSFLSIMSASTY